MFEDYRQKALARFVDEPRKINSEEISKLESLLEQWTINRTLKTRLLLRRVLHDTRYYPFYEALAAWMDDKNGLAKHYPAEMEQVAELFLDNW